MRDILELKLALLEGKQKRARPEWRQNSHFVTLLYQQFGGQKMTSPPFMEVPQMLKLSAYLCDLREEISDDENLIGLENWGGNREQCSASKLKCY